jgi:hypothetical protein
MGGPRFTPVLNCAMAERYANGETMEQLATDYEVGIGTIWRCLQSSAQAAPSNPIG